MYIENPFVTELLAHSYGHPGSVSVPAPVPEGEEWGAFPSGVLETLTHMINAVKDDREPEIINWYFLVGAPGNGKSEALRYICQDLGLSLPARTPGSPAPRTLPETWPTSGLDVVSTSLVLVNDASVPRPDLVPGVLSLGQDLLDAQKWLESLKTVVLVCNVNRGVLIEEQSAAMTSSAYSDEVRAVLSWLADPSEPGNMGRVVQPTARAPYYGQARVTIGGWQVAIHAVFLDKVSLLEQLAADGPSIDFASDVPIVASYKPSGSVSPGDGRLNTIAGQWLQRAAQTAHWVDSGCRDKDTQTLCKAHSHCPFAQNAKWLSQAEARKHILSILRAHEVSAGRRITYRDLVGMTAKLILGTPEQDWTGNQHPCAWVEHQHLALEDGANRAGALTRLILHRLYQNLWPSPYTAVGEEIVRQSPPINSRPIFATLARSFSAVTADRPTYLVVAGLQLDSGLDVSEWDGNRREVLRIVEAASVQPIQVGLVAIGLPSECTSALEVDFDNEFVAEIGMASRSTARVDRTRVRWLLQWRSLLAQRQYGVAAGFFRHRGAVQAWLSEQKAAMSGLAGTQLKIGLRALIVPGEHESMYIAPLRSRTRPLTGELPARTIIQRIDTQSIAVKVEAEGDSLIAAIVDAANQAPIARVLVDLTLTREALLQGGPRPGFTESPLANLARVERARANLTRSTAVHATDFFYTDAMGRLHPLVEEGQDGFTS